MYFINHQKLLYVMIILIFIIVVYGLMYENIVRTQIVSQMLVLEHHNFADGEHEKVVQILNVQTPAELIISD